VTIIDRVPLSYLPVCALANCLHAHSLMACVRARCLPACLLVSFPPACLRRHCLPTRGVTACLPARGVTACLPAASLPACPRRHCPPACALPARAPCLPAFLPARFHLITIQTTSPQAAIAAASVCILRNSQTCHVQLTDSKSGATPSGRVPGSLWFKSSFFQVLRLLRAQKVFTYF